MLDHHQVRQLAYLLWEQQGRPSDRQHDNWLEAERRLRDAVAPKRKATPRKLAAREAATAGTTPDTTGRPRRRIAQTT